MIRLIEAELSACGNVLGSNSYLAGPKHRTVHKYGTYVPLTFYNESTLNFGPTPFNTLHRKNCKFNPKSHSNRNC